ncbi:hypothetical protein H0H87_004123 [Tephrocybe sp. NHM501043]|nr:hypothetical protein H0H87_004123 [Tephrocybe sp. NHM501043]
MQAVSRLHKCLQPFACSLSTNTPTPQSPKINLPPLPQEIWLEIMQFATYVHHHHSIVPLDPFAQCRVSRDVMAPNTPSLSTRTKLSLVLVSRSWHKIALQIFYNYLQIRSPTRAEGLLTALERSSHGPPEQRLHHGQWTRHIEIYTHARRAGELQYLKTLFRIFQECPNLRILSGHWNHALPPEFLNAISRSFGPRLQGLYWDDHKVAAWPKATISSPIFLGTFVALQTLDLRNYGGNSNIGNTTVTFPDVKYLILSNSPPGILVSTVLDLPALRNLTLKTHPIIGGASADLLIKFLTIHGAHLKSVDLHSPTMESDATDSYLGRRATCSFRPDIFLQGDLCPNLVTLTFPASSPLLDHKIRHPLRRIGLRGVRADTIYPDKETHTKKHLLSFTSERYPKLEVVRTVGFLADADTDNLVKDIFIWWVHKFEQEGVDFLDGEGVLWAYTDAMDN